MTETESEAGTVDVEVQIGGVTVALSILAKLVEPAPGSDLRGVTDILSKLRLLRNDIESRIKHGADCGGHLPYVVMGRLESILKEFSPDA